MIPDEASDGLRIDVTTQPMSCITGIRKASGASAMWEEAAVERARGVRRESERKRDR